TAGRSGAAGVGAGSRRPCRVVLCRGRIHSPWSPILRSIENIRCAALLLERLAFLALAPACVGGRLAREADRDLDAAHEGKPVDTQEWRRGAGVVAQVGLVLEAAEYADPGAVDGEPRRYDDLGPAHDGDDEELGGPAGEV